MYQKQLILAFSGVAMCATPFLISFAPKAIAYAKAQIIEGQAQLERDREVSSENTYRNKIIQQAQTSEQLYKSGVAADTKNLRIRRFVDDGVTNPRPDTSGYRSDQLVMVFDSNGRYIGKIQNNTWHWKYSKEAN